MRGGSVTAAALALAASALVWHAHGPAWTLAQVRAAAEARDAAALAELLDAPALRASLAVGPRARLPGTTDAALADAALAALTGAAPRADVRGPALPPPGSVLIARDGLRAFRVRDARDPAAGSLVFVRRGHAWRLAGLEPGAAATAASAP